jgi:hypothetical protein
MDRLRTTRTEMGPGIGSARKASRNPRFFRNALRFEGECEDLNRSTYDCPDSRNPDQYMKTTKVIAGLVARRV